MVVYDNTSIAAFVTIFDAFSIYQLVTLVAGATNHLIVILVLTLAIQFKVLLAIGVYEILIKRLDLPRISIPEFFHLLHANPAI